MLDHYLLDVVRVDIHASGDDQVFLTIGEKEEAVVIYVAEVAGIEPALSDRLSREIGRL